MTMISVASAAVTKVPVSVTRIPVNVSLQVSTILSNVLVYYECRNSDDSLWGWGHLSGFQTGVGAQFSKSGYIQFITFLVPQFNRVISNSPISIEYIVGAGDGTGSDFSGTNAANVAISILPNTSTNNILGYTGPLTSFNEDSMLNQGAILKASIKDGYFYGNAPNNSTANLSIEPDSNGVSMLEDKVWIHMYDVNNNLLGIVDVTRDANNRATVINKNVNFNYGGGNGDFQIFALIIPKPDPNDAKSTIFEIGDPKTNAKVTISQS
ncbi:MAG: hypothetical protein JNK77_10900 [Saprospiraceae bacterium]|nr:hypothetical protein [Saprospiraceae bacterium]